MEIAMNARMLGRVIVALVIAAMLGGAYLIVAKDGPRPGATSDQAPGFMH
jgi:hypothetical protein